MHKRKTNHIAFFAALCTFILITVLTMVLYTRIDFATANLPEYLLATLFFAGSLIAVIVFQALHIKDDATKLAHGLAQNMAKDMFISSRELFSELYRGSPVPYVIITGDGFVSSTNASAIRLFGITEGELDGKNIFEYIEGDDEVKVGMYPEKLKQGLFVSDDEVRIIRKDGKQRWVLLSLFSFTDNKGHRNGLLTLVDISKQKEIDRAKTEFVSLASHQLRTPITAMRWNMELLFTKFGGEFSDLEKSYLIKVQNSIMRMNNLVDDFLNVSKFELGTLVPQKSAIALRTFFDDFLEEHLVRATDRQVTLTLNLDETLESIITDEKLLSMALNNLVSNAIKYTPEGGSVFIDLSHGPSTLTISVTDTGMGIPKDEQDRLFTKIFRASNAVKNVPDGTGLGLYIADQSVRVLGGSITVASEEGKGTCFTVLIPRN